MAVNLEKTQQVVILRLDNPPVNALNKTLLQELHGCVQKVSQQLKSGEVRAMVVTGSGPKFFAAGADITHFPELEPEAGLEFSKDGQQAFNELACLSCPVIAAINGYALGGGLELALACDIRIAAANAKLGMPEINLGVFPGYGGTQRLARLVGPGKAKELIFTGQHITAQEALDLGLVEHVVSEGEALNEALRLANLICSKAPLSLGAAKDAINRGLDLPLDEGLRVEAENFSAICGTRDQKEGALAFLEKRTPEFTGT
jgi:enoyl-CoA hydratase/carnithine racemase